MIRIVLAGAVMGKQRPRFTQAGQQPYTPQKTVHYEARLAYAAQQAMAGQPLLTGPLRVDIDVRMAVPLSKPKKWRSQALSGVIRPTKKPDIDNVSKFVDALNLIVWADDAQIVELTARKFYSDAPSLTITIEKIETGVFA